MATELSVFASEESLQTSQRMAKVLMSSDFVPDRYKDGTPKAMANALYAREIAIQQNIPWIEVMQNLDIVKGRPMWQSRYLIERMAQKGIEPNYEFEERGKKKIQYDVWVGAKNERRKEIKTFDVVDRACRFIATKGDKVITGPWVSIEMAVREGWYTRDGSKWPNMEEKMLMYAAAREYNKYYPTVSLASIPTEDEVTDWEPTTTTAADAVDELNNFEKNSGAMADWAEDATVETQEPDDDEII